jgi:hypothetical protein
MSRRAVAVLISLLAMTSLAASVRDAAARSCFLSPVPLTPAQFEAKVRRDLLEAQAVFIGRVVSSDMLKVRFEVEVVWAGEIARDLSMNAGAVERDGSIRHSTLDSSFQTGETYLVFAYGESLERMSAPTCMLTTPIEYATETIRSLDRITGRITFAQRRMPRDELTAARQKWASAAMASYEYTFQASCFCEEAFRQPVTFRVVEGRGVLTNAVPDRVRQLFERYDTFEKLFEFVEMALERRAFKTSVRYDRDRGYPSVVDVDYRELAKDDEMRFTVTGFKILQ